MALANRYRRRMGFLAGSSSIVRFHADVPPRIDREKVCAAIRRDAFREHDEDGLPRPESFGWVAIHDPLVVEVEAHDVFFQQYLVLGFRYDKRVAPGKLVRLERRRAEEERKRELGQDRLGRETRKEIKEQVAARLLAMALPSPSLFECAWNLETQTLYFTGKSRGPKEAFSSLFRETFGVTPIPVIPYLAAERVGLDPATVDALRAVEPSRFTVEAGALDQEEARLAEAGGRALGAAAGATGGGF